MPGPLGIFLGFLNLRGVTSYPREAGVPAPVCPAFKFPLEFPHVASGAQGRTAGAGAQPESESLRPPALGVAGRAAARAQPGLPCGFSTACLPPASTSAGCDGAPVSALPQPSRSHCPGPACCLYEVAHWAGRPALRGSWDAGLLLPGKQGQAGHPVPTSGRRMKAEGTAMGGWGVSFGISLDDSEEVLGPCRACGSCRCSRTTLAVPRSWCTTRA